MGFVASVCQPSILRMLIWPEASSAQNNIAAVSADGSTVCVLILRLNQPVRDHTLPKSKQGAACRRWLKIGANEGETAMPLKHLAIGFAIIAAMPAVFTSALAGDGLYVPFFTYRTGPFAGSGIPYANGLTDYLTMLNERDGGIGGAKLIIEECETGYDTKKGVECYDSVKRKNPVVVNPWSTGITLQLIPKAAVDKIPILSMAYGLSASADGNLFPWIFNPPATYWDGLSMIFKYIGDKEGGLEKLKGKTIGYIFFDGGYGREPIPLLEQLD